MKKWGKTLIWVGIVWIILVIIFLSVLYVKLPSIKVISYNSIIAGFLNTINLNSLANSLFRWFIVLVIPSVVLFVIAGIWGRRE